MNILKWLYISEEKKAKMPNRKSKNLSQIERLNKISSSRKQEIK